MEILKPTLIVSTNEGFGINTNILETNLINQLILGISLFILGQKFLTESLTVRQNTIFNKLRNSETRLKEAQQQLNEAENQLKQAELIITQIKESKEKTKITLLTTDFEQSKAELSRRFKIAKSILTNRERSILSEIKQEISKSALINVVSQLEKNSGKEANQINYMIDAIESLSLSKLQ
jgi:F-type H+-transporting ATPase subunit b